LTQRRKEPSFFLTKRTGAACGDLEEQMKPNARCLSMNSRRVQSSDGEREYVRPSGGWAPSSSSIFRSTGQCGAKVSALDLLKTSVKSWYSSGTPVKSALLSTLAARPLSEERDMEKL